MYTHIFFYFLVLVLIPSSSLSFAQNSSTPIFRKSIQSADGPKLIDPNLKLQLVFEGVGFFSNMAFLGPADILALDKNRGTVQEIVNGTISSEPIFDAKVATKSERGILGIAISPKYKANEGVSNKQNGENQNNVQESLKKDKYVFLYFTEARTSDGDDKNGSKPIGNRLYRYEFINDTHLGNPKLLLDLPAMPGPGHNGGSLTVGPDNNLYLSIGNVNEIERKSFWTTAENYYYGKYPDGRGGILRIGQDGEPVKGVLGDTYPMNLYFAYGIRNSFGMDFDPLTHKLWDTENGPNYGDEVNVVDPGFNSGWNRLQGIWERQNGSTLAGNVSLNPEGLNDFNGKGRYSSPEFMWYTPVGVTALTFLDSDKLGKQYQNDLFIGDFHTGNLYHFDLTENRTKLSLNGSLKDNIANNNSELEGITFGRGFGGITAIEVGPDGYIYILSLDIGGSNCIPKYPNVPCVSYSSPNVSRVFRILSLNENKH